MSERVVIESPVLGLANFLGSRGSRLAEADARALGSYFEETRRRDGWVPHCDVLLLYCTLGPDGRIVGDGVDVRELVHASASSIVILAADEPDDASYLEVFAGRSTPAVSLVQVARRKGAAFARFFAQLFSSMRRGISMPVAWVQIAPQRPSPRSYDLPEAIFVCDAGPVAFGCRRPPHHAAVPIDFPPVRSAPSPRRGSGWSLLQPIQ